MKHKVVFIVFLVLFLSCGFACVFPQTQNLYASENLSNEEERQLNDSFEEEPSSQVYITPKITVEKLNWFNTVNSLFEKFSHARVIDILSQKEYFVERVGGYNHADVETLTTGDTNIFKGIYGGTWSWTRRPVWVEINGVFVAGSINGMPHSYEYITDNNESGHTCIHFYMSRTHGTNNLDPEHQKAVEYAHSHGDEINDYIWKKQY